MKDKNKNRRMKDNRYKIPYLVLALMLFAFSVDAQPTSLMPVIKHNSGSGKNSITQEAYRDKVLNYSMQLKMAKESVIQAQSGVKAVKTGMLPQLSGALDFNYMMKSIAFDLGNSSMKLKPSNYGASVTAAQNVYAGGAVRKKVRVAEYNSEIAESAQLLTIDNIIYNSDFVYWTASGIVSHLSVVKEYLNVVKETQTLVKERYESGLISKNDLLLIDTRVSEAELSHSQIEGQFKNAMIGVNMLMGNSPNAEVYIAEDILVETKQDIVPADINHVLTRRPEYLISASQLNQSREELRVTKSDYLPQLAVGVTGQYQTQSINLNGKALGNGIAFAQVKIPIFSGNSRKHRISIDNSRIRSNEYAMNEVRDQVIQDVAASWTNYEDRKNQLIIAKENLSTATESLNLNSFSFNQGLLSIIDLMQTQLSWFGAYNNFIQANYNYRISITQYNKSTGEYDRMSAIDEN